MHLVLGVNLGEGIKTMARSHLESSIKQALLGALKNSAKIDAGYMQKHQKRLGDYVDGLSNAIVAIEQRMQDALDKRAQSQPTNSSTSTCCSRMHPCQWMD